jgi:hypothetical protein
VTYPNQPPRPAPPAGGFRPGPPPGGFRPSPPPGGHPGQQPGGHPGHQPDQRPDRQPHPELGAPAQASSEYRLDATGGTGHPAVDAVLQSLANAAMLAPADQIAEYEAAHQVLQETLAGIDR